MSKVILITGASAGMGKATAKQLISEGHIVYGAARRVENMQDLVQLGGNALKLDVSNSENIESVVEEIIAAHGRIDVLVNNAGYSVYGSVENVSDEDAKKQFDVNLFGAAALTKRVIPHMRQNQSGHIINVTSVGGKIGFPLGAWYHASKHALEGWSDSLRMELTQFGINVSIVEPGAIASEFYEVMNEPMIKRDKGTVYDSIMNGIIKTNRNTNDGSPSTKPEVIAGVITKAIASKRPKTRYVAGKGAKAVLLMRKLLSDRGFDKAILNLLK
ncbi:oxidoreductase [uncultured Vibrio sp.]|uniref:oxidoreductase n=1 Tax=uncultured Vibrio sp. TaxID=114054 RepID=UPI0025EBB74D|nr:oxidoreductase [uncultured Vibrio sp.]